VIPGRIPITAVPAATAVLVGERSCRVSFVVGSLSAVISSRVRTYTLRRFAPTIANRCLRTVKHLHEQDLVDPPLRLLAQWQDE
jgi:hypothetical protein